MRLAEATGLSLNKRVLAFHEAPPQPSADKLLESQRAIAGPLFSRPTTLGTSTNAVKNRKMRTAPERVLDAPGIVDDYYLNLVDWSSENVVAVGLAESAYIWRADRGTVSHVTDAPESCYISSLQFSNDGAYLAVAFNTGSIELWDVEANKRLRTMHGRQAQVAVMSWNQHLLSSGCQDGAIWHHDVRISQHKVMELIGHNGEVCGLQWRPDGELLASGGNDNVVNIWDGRTGDVLPGGRGAPKWTKRNHTAAVKVRRGLRCLYVTDFPQHDRPSHGALGSLLCSLLVVERVMPRLTSGTLRQALGFRLQKRRHKLLLFTSPLIGKSLSQPTACQQTLSWCMHILPWRRWQKSGTHMMLACFTVGWLLMGRCWSLRRGMRTLSFGKYGRHHQRRRWRRTGGC
jgi:hypothetical protein